MHGRVWGQGCRYRAEVSGQRLVQLQTVGQMAPEASPSCWAVRQVAKDHADSRRCGGQSPGLTGALLTEQVSRQTGGLCKHTHTPHCAGQSEGRSLSPQDDSGVTARLTPQARAAGAKPRRPSSSPKKVQKGWPQGLHQPL